MRSAMATAGMWHLTVVFQDILEYGFGRYYSPNTGGAYLCPQPSEASMKRLIDKIRPASARNVLRLSAEEMASGFSRQIVKVAS
jgi:hypothetical protein